MPEEEIEELNDLPTEELDQVVNEYETRRIIHNQQINNNAQNLRNISRNLQNKNIPYASDIARGIHIADKVSGGRSTQKLAKKLDKVSPIGISDKGDNKFKLKMPISVKMNVALIVIAIFAAFLIFVTLFIVLSDKDAAMGSSSGMFMYGETCPTIEIINSGCDETAKNCTNEYNGKVDLETYIAGVVAPEVGDINNQEYYKVAAIIARTNVQNTISSSCTVEGNINYQEYIDIETSEYADEIKSAVSATKNIVMIKNEELITVTAQEGNNAWKINQQEALGLIQNNHYSYEQVLKYYYGNDVQLTNNSMVLSGVNGFVNPVRYINCTSAFGERIHPFSHKRTIHTGLDLKNNKGEPIYAAKSGKIIAVKKNVKEGITLEEACKIENGITTGNYVKIEHEDGTITLYAHMKNKSIPEKIKVGYVVKQGEQIGQVGSTGCSTGDHLHYEVRKDGNHVNPADYIDLSGLSADEIKDCKSNN